MIQYYLFDSDNKYLSTNYFDVKPTNSTIIAPVVASEYAVWNGTQWIDSRGDNYISVPESVTAIQFLTQMEIQGISQDEIVNIIDQLPNPSNIMAKNSFYRATIFDRSNVLLEAVATKFGITQEEMDILFINASQL